MQDHDSPPPTDAETDVFFIEDVPGAPRFWPISALALELGVTRRMLRSYESLGLIAPERDGARRVYARSDRRVIDAILRLKRIGFSGREIAGMVERARVDGLGPDAIRPTREACAARIADLEEKRAEIDQALAELRDMIARL